MILFTHIQPLKAYLQAQKEKGRTIGLVPTMGALHQGHLSLIAKSKATSDITVCSIFVNPTQFNNPEDLRLYPRTIEEDLKLLTKADCDVLFHPTAEEMYPNGQYSEKYSWGALTDSWEGAFRPGHFDGVITVVKHLFEIVEPHQAFFGQKDFQQCAVIQNLVKEFNLPVKIVVEPTLREEDGLAMSSRNQRLTPEERQQSIGLSKILFQMQSRYGQVNADTLIQEAYALLGQYSLLKVEYIGIVDKETLVEIPKEQVANKSVVLIAAWCGNVRLIDNIALGD